jgi:hypothetical protein
MTLVKTDTQTITEAFIQSTLQNSRSYDQNEFEFLGMIKPSSIISMMTVTAAVLIAISF